MRPVTTWLLFYAGLCLVTSIMPVAIAQTQTMDEQLLKAVFVYNFAKFTSWPENVWSGPNAPLTLCITGKDEVAGALEQISGRTIDGHPVNIRSGVDLPVPGDCQVLYIAASEQTRYVNMVETLRGRPILTVSCLSRFVGTGGIIELYRKDGRIRFSINLEIASGAGLDLSSRLLMLAVVVDSGEAP